MCKNYLWNDRVTLAQEVIFRVICIINECQTARVYSHVNKIGEEASTVSWVKLVVE